MQFHVKYIYKKNNKQRIFVESNVIRIAKRYMFWGHQICDEWRISDVLGIQLCWTCCVPYVNTGCHKLLAHFKHYYTDSQNEKEIESIGVKEHMLVQDVHI